MFLYTVITTVIYYVQILMSVPWALRYVSISVLIFMEATTVHATGGTKSRVTTTVQVRNKCQNNVYIHDITVSIAQ